MVLFEESEAAHLQSCQKGLYKLLRVLQVLIHALAHEGIPKALEDRVGCLQDTLHMNRACTSAWLVYSLFFPIKPHNKA